MKSIVLNAFAKINLSIDVIGRRPDGYHEVLMVMQEIDLFDKVRLSWEPGAAPSSKDAQEGQPNVTIRLTTSLPFLPTDEKNLAYKAAELMARAFPPEERGIVTIHINKHIPVAAGLAGGSSNGAAVLHGLAKLWEKSLSLQQLMDLGTKLGADVPFCIMGQAALNPSLGFISSEKETIGTCAVASGIGEKLAVVPGIDCWALLSKPPIGVSTAKVYGGLELDEIPRRPDTEELVQGLREKNFQKVIKNMINVLENVSLKEYPIIVYTKNKMEEAGKDRKALMSGSGPTVFSLYTNKAKAKIAYGRLKELNHETFLVKCLT